MAMRSGFGIGRARPPLMKATRTCASTRSSSPRMTRWRSVDGRALHFLRLGDDVEHVVHARGLEEFDVHRAHHEGKARRLLFGLLEQRAVVGADQAQIIGAPALHEAQIIGVIDDAGEIGVLVIDAHDLHVPAVADFAVERERHVIASSPRHPAGHGVFPVLAVEYLDVERGKIDAVEAAHVDVDLVRIGARHVERMDAAG